MSEFYSRYVEAMSSALRDSIVTDRSGRTSGTEQGLRELCERTRQVRDDKRSLYFCGNGASATMASHLSVDWLKNGGVRSAVLTDQAMLTAYANDTGYANVFEGPLRRLGERGDMLVGISSSGASPNVVNAITAAREMNLFVVTLTGFRPDNPARALGDVNFYVPAQTYGLTECSHQVILHAWFDCFMAEHGS